MVLPRCGAPRRRSSPTPLSAGTSPNRSAFIVLTAPGATVGTPSYGTDAREGRQPAAEPAGSDSSPGQGGIHGVDGSERPARARLGDGRVGAQPGRRVGPASVATPQVRQRPCAARLVRGAAGRRHRRRPACRDPRPASCGFTRHRGVGRRTGRARDCDRRGRRSSRPTVAPPLGALLQALARLPGSSSVTVRSGAAEAAVDAPRARSRPASSVENFPVPQEAAEVGRDARSRR